MKKLLSLTSIILIGMVCTYCSDSNVEDQTTETTEFNDTTRDDSIQQQKLKHLIDFETGNLNQGTTDPCGGGSTEGCDCATGTSVVLNHESKGPVRSGNYSFESRVIDCHERAEMKIKGILTGNTDWWVGWSIFIPQDYVKSQGGIITQFHDVLGGGGQNSNPCPDYSRGGPSLFNFSSTGMLQFLMRHQRTNCDNCLSRTAFPDLKDIEDMRGKWTDFVVNANFSCNPEVGFFRFWIRGEGEAWPENPVIDYVGSTFPEGKTSSGPNFRTGLYFGNPGKVGGNTMVIYADEMKAGKASDGVVFKDVAPGGDMP